ncbi:MAG: DUF5009 domain-containing protein [Acidobacteriia bacterium]|nr:DUF5009 domain-containing protein [Terriglobia bacterium]
MSGPMETLNAVVQPANATHDSPSNPQAPDRLVSLDAFRGLTIAFMILVNNPGTWNAVYRPLEHAPWNGWTLTDLVFPFFLFIVGVSMTMSFARRQERGDGRGSLFLQVVKRTVIIFVLGLVLNGFPYYHFSTLRIPGVLQRIAVCYFIAAVIYLTCKLRGQILVTLAFLIGYWILMKTVNVPGFGHGILTPEGNLAAYLDNKYLHGHIYRPTWDPEGMLSTLPAVTTTLFGIFAGQWMRHTKSIASRLWGLILSGTIGIILGQIMNVWFPINKNLWTSSYAVFTAGAALLLFAICYWVIDVRGFKSWSIPLRIYGTNAIAAYVLSSLMGTASVTWRISQGGRFWTYKGFLFSKFYAPWANPFNASMLWGLSYVILWMGILWMLYRRRIFIKI